VSLMALAGGVAVFAGCQYLGRDVSPYRPPAYYQLPGIAPEIEGAEAGRELYLRDCSFCHGNRGEGTDNGPPLDEGTNGAALTDFMLRTGRMPIDHPRAPSRSSEPVYTAEEIAALVEYVVSAFRPPGPPVPAVEPARGDLSAGQQLYEQYCAACHAPTGIGGAMLTQRGRATRGGTTGVLIPGFEHSDAIEIAEAIRTGPGTMPVFGPDLVTQEEFDALVRYTLYLKEPEDPGGLPIGHIGPVAEGAVGWVLGLGLLLGFIRWIGTKAGKV
jgi:ubiquinol-cytochrome c reductase cytochrome c subunit